MGINNSPIKKEIMMLDFRISQLEIALSSLMHVVANQDEELDEFSKLLNRAEKKFKKLSIEEEKIKKQIDGD